MGNYEYTTRANSFLLALYLMQYTLMLPFTKIMNATLLTAGSSLLILLLFVIINKRIRVNLRFILVLSATILLIAVKVFLFPSSDKSIFLVFAYTAFPAAFAVAYDYHAGTVLKDLYKISMFSFFLVFWHPFIGQSSYMRFGYAVLPSVLFILIELLYNKQMAFPEKLIAAAIGLILLAEMFLFGARGCFFCFLLFFAIEELLINRENLKRKLVLFLGALLAVLNIGPIIDLVYNVLLRLGIHSYALIKYRMQLQRGFEAASSGRDSLYGTAIDELRRSPFFGVPISLSSEEGNPTYVHNLFLQTWMDVGIIGLAVLVVFILTVVRKIWSQAYKKNERVLVAAVFSVSIGRLMFSSVIWRRPEFWLLVFMSMKMEKRRHEHTKARVEERV